MYTICTIKPYTGMINSQYVVNDLNKFYTPDPDNINSLQFYLDNLPYIYDIEAMMYLYKSAFQTFYGENPINLDEGISWQNIAAYPFKNWIQLNSVLAANYTRAIEDTNAKLSDTQLDFAGELISCQAVGVEETTRILSVNVIIGFPKLQQIINDTNNLIIGSPNLSTKEIIQGIINGK